ncbi:MAG: hypothetical protein U5N26_09545 [Candidatus Marinimicrobia bacterium]|nr:hypothetical protein [Candidatus Neomarinimicrobiota bacterium]
MLSGDIGIEGQSDDNSYHVLSYDGIMDEATLIDGFTVRDGNADNGEGGGGIFL